MSLASEEFFCSKIEQKSRLNKERHVPDFAESLKEPEQADFEEGVAILLAESKVDGSPIGSLRIQTNQFQPLELDHSLTLPDWLQNCSIAEASRLSVQGKMGAWLK